MSKIIPLTILAGVGAWLAQLRGVFAAEPVNAGQGPQPSTGGNQTPVTTPRPPTALPADIPLSFDQVFNLAKAMVRAHGFMVTAQELTVTAYIESSFRPWVKREERTTAGKVWDTSFGLMQTLTGTAMDMYNKGYKGAGVPNAQTLKLPEVSMYFGAAYKDWLKRTYAGKSAEWYVRAYNGGPGWERTANGPVNTLTYYQRYVSHAKRLFGAL